MNNEKINEIKELLAGLIVEGYGAIETLLDAQIKLNEILDGYVLVTKKNADVLLNDVVFIKKETANALSKMVNIRIKNDTDDPRMGGRSTEDMYTLKQNLKAALVGQ
jgi:hypothetical protein